LEKGNPAWLLFTGIFKKAGKPGIDLVLIFEKKPAKKPASFIPSEPEVQPNHNHIGGHFVRNLARRNCAIGI